MENVVKIQILATNEATKNVVDGPNVELFKVEIPKDKYTTEHFVEVVTMSLQLWRVASALKHMVVRKDNLNLVTYVR